MGKKVMQEENMWRLSKQDLGRKKERERRDMGNEEEETREQVNRAG